MCYSQLNKNNKKLNRRQEAKLTVTEKLTKRLAVSLASLKNFPRRLRHVTSQSSITVVEISNDMPSEIRTSAEKISIDESSSDETIKASSNEITAMHPIEVHHTSPCNTSNYSTTPPQRYLGSLGEMKFEESDVGSKSLESISYREQIELQRFPVDLLLNACSMIRRGVDSQDEACCEENVTNYETADRESDQEVSETSDHEDEASNDWNSPI